MARYFWRTDGKLYSVGPGIEILKPQIIEIPDETGTKVTVIKPEPGFINYVKQCLNWLYRTRCGKTVLTTVASAGNCTIGSSRGNSAGVGNMQAAMTTVAYEIAKGGKPGTNARAALKKTFAAYGARRRALTYRVSDKSNEYAWLASAVNAQPQWLLNREPGSDGGIKSYFQTARTMMNRWSPGLWTSDPSGGHFDSELWMGPVGRSAAGLRLTTLEAQSWMQLGTLPVRLSSGLKDQLKLATIVALEEFSTPGSGSPSAVRFSYGKNDKFRSERPPAIALGHEVLHAYFSLLGKQPGIEFSHFSTVLFEFKCVGLGPWNEETNSENGLRKEWPMISPSISAKNYPYDRKNPGKRMRY